MNKYTYLLVIQQNYSGVYGWEDVSEYEVDSRYMGGQYNDWKHDVKEYRLMGYPTRTIKRREVKEQVINACDHGHETTGEVRVLPINPDNPMGSNIILCYAHYRHEIEWRKERNLDLEDSAKFDLPKWESLKVYNIE
jgi:hypothetical protein